MDCRRRLNRRRGRSQGKERWSPPAGMTSIFGNYQALGSRLWLADSTLSEYGSGFCSLLQWLSRCQQKIGFFCLFFTTFTSVFQDLSYLGVTILYLMFSYFFMLIEESVSRFRVRTNNNVNVSGRSRNSRIRDPGHCRKSTNWQFALIFISAKPFTNFAFEVDLNLLLGPCDGRKTHCFAGFRYFFFPIVTQLWVAISFNLSSTPSCCLIDEFTSKARLPHMIVWNEWGEPPVCFRLKEREISPSSADPPSPPSTRGKAGKNQLNEEITPPPPLWDRREIQPNHIKFRTCSALAPMWTPSINGSAELTHGAL